MQRETLMAQLTVAAVSLALTGCDESTANSVSSPATSDGGSGPAMSSGWQTVTVTGEPYIEQVELPGAFVRGYETTQLLAKLGGYVQEIAKVDGREIDIGSLADRGNVLALLDVPEMMDEVREKRAMVVRAKSEVTQKEAAVEQALEGVKLHEAEVDQAEAQRDSKQAFLKFRQVEYDRIDGLVSSGSVAKENRDAAKYEFDAAQAALDSVEADVKAAEAGVQAARAQVKKAQADKQNADARVRVTEATANRVETLVDYAIIRAPFRGVITRRFVNHGAFVKPAGSNSGAMPLFEITRIDRVKIVASVPNIKAGQIHAGQPVRFHSIGGLPGQSFRQDRSGKRLEIARTAHSLSPDSRMLPIEIDFDNQAKNPQGQQALSSLMPGMYGTLTVMLKEWTTDNPLPLVPTAAVATDLLTGESYVMVVDKERKAHRRTVEIVFDDAVNVGMRKGAKVGEMVVVGDLKKIQDGQQITSASQ